jgi:hypothetical protein
MISSRTINANIIDFIMTRHSNVHIISLSDRTHSRGISWLYTDVNDKNDTYKLVIRGMKDFWRQWSMAMATKSVRFIAIFLRIEARYRGHTHANLLIYDKKTNELERFDSRGANIQEFYKTDEMDEAIDAFFRGSLSGFMYVTPKDYCPKEMFQTLERNERPGVKSCAAWRAWYLDIRLANPNISRNKLVCQELRRIATHGSFAKFIDAFLAGYVAHPLGTSFVDHEYARKHKGHTNQLSR